jgi:hypothetical protein
MGVYGFLALAVRGVGAGVGSCFFGAKDCSLPLVCVGDWDRVGGGGNVVCCDVLRTSCLSFTSALIPRMRP